MRGRAGMLWFAMIVLAVPVHARANCALSTPAAAAAKVQAHLQSRVVEEMQTDVAPEVRQEIHALKDALVAVADARLACEHDGAVDATTVQSDLATAMETSLAAYSPPSTDSASYGGALKVSVQRSPDAPSLVLVRFGFGIECGDDNLLLAYALRDGAWRLLLRWQSADYKEISGAYGNDFQYIVLPGATPRLVVWHGTPWCTSRWSSSGLDVLAPGKDAATPQVLFHQAHGYVTGDVEPTLKLKPDGFEWRAEVGMRDMDVMTRMGIYRYRVEGDRVSRVQPAALNGRDFVDEWLQVKWSDASAWSDPSGLAELERMHGQLAADFDSQTDAKAFTYGAMRACPDDAHTYQVQLDLASEKSAPGKVDSVVSRYFRIRSGANDFTMLSVSSTPGQSCKGGDLMKKH